MLDQIKASIEQSIATKQLILADQNLLLAIQKASQQMVDCFRKDGKVLFGGNGGSAADAQHLASELSGRFYLDRPPLFAEALHVNGSYLTAVGNDYSFDKVYSRIVEAKGRKGDILVAISTSGNSENIVQALAQAKKQGMLTIGLTGAKEGIMNPLCDILLAMPSVDTPRIQECHIVVGHIICQLVEAALFGTS